jgi:hypothetical protein
MGTIALIDISLSAKFTSVSAKKQLVPEIKEAINLIEKVDKPTRQKHKGLHWSIEAQYAIDLSDYPPYSMLSFFLQPKIYKSIKNLVFEIIVPEGGRRLYLAYNHLPKSDEEAEISTLFLESCFKFNDFGTRDKLIPYIKSLFSIDEQKQVAKIAKVDEIMANEWHFNVAFCLVKISPFEVFKSIIENVRRDVEYADVLITFPHYMEDTAETYHLVIDKTYYTLITERDMDD